MRGPGRRGTQSLGEILSDLVARKGFARFRGQEELETTWRTVVAQVVGELAARHTRPGSVRHGTLEVLVANSVLLQELAGFHKQALLERLRKAHGMESVRDLRFRLEENSS